MVLGARCVLYVDSEECVSFGACWAVCLVADGGSVIEQLGWSGSSDRGNKRGILESPRLRMSEHNVDKLNHQMQD